MSPWKPALRQGVIAGSLASVFSTAALALAGRRQAGSALAPTNAESQWLWGEEALHADGLSWRHTALGYATHHLACIFWATLYARVYGRRPEAQRLPQAAAGALAASAAAFAIDYSVVPRRLRPGFEHRVSRSGMAGAFAGIAAGIALGTLLLRPRD